MNEAFRIMTDEEILNSDPMVHLRCKAGVYGGKRRCRNLSAWMPKSLLVDENGNYFCNFHIGSPVYALGEDHD